MKSLTSFMLLLCVSAGSLVAGSGCSGCPCVEPTKTVAEDRCGACGGKTQKDKLEDATDTERCGCRTQRDVPADSAEAERCGCRTQRDVPAQTMTKSKKR